MTLPRMPRFVAVLPLVAAFAFPCAVASAASWELPPTAGPFAVDAGTFGPSLRVPGAVGAWVQYAPGLSVDCSPPRGCLANTQRLHYVFNCAPRYAVLVERISYDLNGNVVNHEVRDLAAGYGIAYDGGANAVLAAFCPVNVHNVPR